MARQHREENRPVPQVNNRQDKNNTSSGYTIVLLCGLTERKETACSRTDKASEECSSRSMHVSLFRCRINTSVLQIEEQEWLLSIRQVDQMGSKVQFFFGYILLCLHF